jgi:putative MFS transporter
VNEQEVIARLERLPSTRWHVKMRVLFGVATFFDSFDAVAIAFALPVLIREWHIAPGQIGGLISIGYVGQMIGALFFGWLAERIGRVKATRITILIFGLMNLLCAVAQDYDQLFWFRFLQGLGLGGEVPIAAAYIAELAPSRRRGQFFLAYEVVFVFGIAAAAIVGAWIVPRYGWQVFFAIGGLPPLIVAVWQRICPESPRWLASKGRLTEAEAVLTEIEGEVVKSSGRDLPPVGPIIERPPSPPTHWQELFKRPYLRRTLVVWVLWASTYMLSNGLYTWLPTLFSSVYKLSVQDSLNLNILPTVMALAAAIMCIFVVDRLGRRPLMAMGLLGAAGCLLILYGLGTSAVMNIIVLTSLVRFFNGIVSFSIYLYTPELYPTRMRALGTSWASFWLRAASMTGPLLIAFIIPRMGIDGVFLVFGLIAALGGLTCLFAALETRSKTLEELAP